MSHRYSDSEMRRGSERTVTRRRKHDEIRWADPVRADPVISAIVDASPRDFAKQLDIATAIRMARR